MTTLEITPEAEPSVHRKKWTVEEYDRLAREGFLPGRYELIAGEIIEKMSPNPPHVIAVTLLAAWLQTLFGMLAFLVDQTQQLCCPLFQAAWRKRGTKRSLWEEIRNCFKSFLFNSMAAILEALIRGIDPQVPVLRDSS